MGPGRRVPSAVRARIGADLRAARSGSDVALAWGFLEEAHVLSQPWSLLHVRVHAAMLGLAVRTRDREEVVGQLLRLAVAGPGSLTGRYPEGNTGRASVPATMSMPVPPHLRSLLSDQP